jgi:dTDP-4-dehydrorhamnose reductase
MKRIVLLGANGQLGTDIRKAFAEASGVEIVTVSRQELDVEDTERVIPFLQSLGDFEVLINCTAYHNTEECESNPLKALMVNCIAVLRMATYCSMHNVVLVHFSTDYVFDGSKQSPYTEDDRTAPLNKYGISKVAGEEVIAAYLDRYFVFRISSLFGTAGLKGEGGNFVETMLRLAREGKSIRVIDDQVMSPTYTLDIAEAVKHFILQDIDAYGIYHCSGEGQCSWHEFAVESIRLCGLPVQVEPVSSKDNEFACKRPAFSVLDNSKINRIYPMPYWRDSLQHYLQQKVYAKYGVEHS